jgi:hypothetical protein
MISESLDLLFARAETFGATAIRLIYHRGLIENQLLDCLFVFLKVYLLLGLQVLKFSGFSGVLLVLIVDLVSLLYCDLLWLVVWVLCKKFLFAFLFKFN